MIKNSFIFKSKKHLKENGFTLIEIIVGMAVGTIVLAIAAVSYSVIINSLSKQEKIIKTLKDQNVINLYFSYILNNSNFYGCANPKNNWINLDVSQASNEVSYLISNFPNIVSFNRGDLENSGCDLNDSSLSFGKKIMCQFDTNNLTNNANNFRYIPDTSDLLFTQYSEEPMEIIGASTLGLVRGEGKNLIISDCNNVYVIAPDNNNEYQYAWDDKYIGMTVSRYEAYIHYNILYTEAEKNTNYVKNPNILKLDKKVFRKGYKRNSGEQSQEEVLNGVEDMGFSILKLSSNDNFESYVTTSAFNNNIFVGEEFYKWNTVPLLKLFFKQTHSDEFNEMQESANNYSTDILIALKGNLA